jgi:acyl-CoA synthetase (AMP-forming)/AMP-acid ligase II
VDVRVVDDDGGRDVAPGAAGELLARGPNVMAGYWRRPIETSLALDEDGWLHTGDAARMDADGDVWIVDRLEARYVSAGEPVFPGDAERALLEHPAVADAGVVGLPNPAGDAAGAAFVVLEPGASVSVDELLAHCRDRLPGPAVPATIAVVDALPRNAVGKLIRPRLAAMAVVGGPDDAPP